MIVVAVSLRARLLWAVSCYTNRPPMSATVKALLMSMVLSFLVSELLSLKDHKHSSDMPAAGARRTRTLPVVKGLSQY